MRPSAVAIDFADYEHTNYPRQSDPDTALPLYHSSMADEKARRRVRVPALPNDQQGPPDYDYDDEGKGVYNKANKSLLGAHIGGGRMPQPPLPPPTTIVRPWSCGCFIHD